MSYLNEKIIVAPASEIEEKCRPHLQNGYVVKHMVAENVSASVTLSGKKIKMRGNIVVVLSPPKEQL